MKRVRRIGEVLASAAVSVALVAASVAVGAPESAGGAAPPRRVEPIDGIDEYPPTGHRAAGEPLLLEGRPAQLGLLLAEDAPEAVRDFYLESFEREGLDARAVGVGGGWTVSALSADGRAQLLVGILPRGARGSLIFPARVGLGGVAGVEASPEIEAAQSSAAVDIARVDWSAGRRVLTWREPGLEPLAAAMRVRDALGRAGWELASWQPGARCRAEFARGERRAWLSVVGAGADTPAGGANVVLQLARGE